MATEVSSVKNVQVNKWIRFGMSAVIFVAGAFITYALNYDWTTVTTPKVAAIIVMAFSFIKSIIDTLAPGSGVETVPTNGTLITHRARRSGEISLDNSGTLDDRSN